MAAVQEGREVLVRILRDNGFGDNDILKILDSIPLKSFSRGAFLANRDGDLSPCFFVLGGCVRLYSVDENGNENTLEFFIEGDFYEGGENEGAAGEVFFLICQEDSVLIYGDRKVEQRLYRMFPALKDTNRGLLEEKLGRVRSTVAQLKSLSPEERYRDFLKKRPGLVNRVPQYQIASYLGIAPESLSRLKRRIS